MRRAETPGPPEEQYGRFIRSQAPGGDRGTDPPSTPEGWERRLAGVRKGLNRSFGRFPDAPCPLDPEILGTLHRDGYDIERLTFQSRPGVRVTANLYRPAETEGRRPGVLCVHGHWAWARIDPIVQTRCIALAKLGYVCLCVDAFGSGERAVEPAPRTYHGGLLGASLWPAGVPLIGLQVYDNRRAVDYLISRPEVDRSRLAITGASGGGNQSLYAGATDDRLSAVIPVCGIGTYESYLAAACCVCEVNAWGLTYTTTGDLLAMMAPRALLVINATRDAPQFSVKAAARSIAYARGRFRMLGRDEALRHVPFESGHDYNQPMREAMYGWLGRWLRGEGDGGPVPEPEVKTEDPQKLRCYPDGRSRPSTIITIPEFAFREGRERLAKLSRPADHKERWEADSARMRLMLRDVLGGFPRTGGLETAVVRQPTHDDLTVRMIPEPGIRLSSTILPTPAQKTVNAKPRGTILMLGTTVLDSDRTGPVPPAAFWSNAGYVSALLGVRALGPWKPQTSAVVGIADHNEAEWGLWVGRPLLGQWVWDALCWVDVLVSAAREAREPGRALRLPRPLILHGRGAMGLAAILAAALEPRIDAVAVEDVLISFVGASPTPWSGVPMGIILPNVLDVGDVGHLAALVAPRPLLVASGIETDGKHATQDRLRSAFEYCTSIYRLLCATGSLKLGIPLEPPLAL